MHIFRNYQFYWTSSIYDDKMNTNHNHNPKKLKVSKIGQISANAATVSTQTLVSACRYSIHYRNMVISELLTNYKLHFNAVYT